MRVSHWTRREVLAAGAALVPAGFIRAQGPAAGLRVGIAEVAVTPSWPTSLWGYDNNDHFTDGILDDIYAKAFLFDNGKRFLIITLDCGAIGFTFYRQVVHYIHEAIKIPEEAVMIQVTHDHAAPALLDIPSTHADLRFQHFLQRKLVDVATAAQKDLAPAKLSYGNTPSFIGLNRRLGNRANTWDKDSGPIDGVMSTLIVSAPDGRKRGILVNYPSHPVCLREDNSKISADFPGVLYRELSKAQGCPVAYMQGCCGDTIPKVFGGVKEMEDYGKKMAGEAQRAVAAAAPLANDQVDFRSARVLLTFIAPYTLDELRANYATIGGRSHYVELWRERYQRYLEDGGDIRESRDTIVQAIRLGDLGIAVMPGEILHLTAELIRKQFPNRKLMVGGYSNDTSVGYLPHADEYPRKGYEVDDAWKYYDTLRTTPDMEKAVREAEIGLLHQLLG